MSTKNIIGKKETLYIDTLMTLVPFIYSFTNVYERYQFGVAFEQK